MEKRIDWSAVWARAEEIRLTKKLIAQRLGVERGTLRNWELRPHRRTLRPVPMAHALAWALETTPEAILAEVAL